MSELPKGCIGSTIADVAQYVQRGKSPKYVGYSDLPVINQKCIRWSGIDEAHLKFVDSSQWSAWGEERFLKSGDILWNSTGTGTIGRAAVFKPLKTSPNAVADSHVTIVRPNGAVVPEFLYRLIESPLVQSRLNDMQSGSTNQVELSKGEVLTTLVPLAPLPEQRRIVSKIDSLTSKSRRARDHLDHIPRLVEKYKQAILSAAFRGELTREFNEAERPSKAEVEICKNALCERLNIRLWKSADDISKVHEGAPERWLGCYIGDVTAHRSGVAFKSGDFTQTGTQVVRLGNLYNGIFDLSRSPVFLKNADQYRAFGGEAGDVLVAQTGTRFKRDYGHFIVLKEDHRGILINQRIACLSPTEMLNPDFLKFFSHLATFKDHFFGHETGGVNQGNVGLAGIMDAPMALPSRTEQDAIVSRLDAAFSWIDRLAADASSARKLINHLDQSVLAKAFKGELVPQDPADEPASALLERIKAESAAAPKPKRGRKKPA